MVALTIRVRTLSWLIAGSMAFVLVFVSLGIRWHCSQAEAAKYARRELDHTFEAASFAQAALAPAATDEARARVDGYRRLAEEHRRAARECAELRKLHESSW